MVWSSFFSNLAATLIGVIIGLPIALLTDRLIKQFEDKKTKIDEKNALIQICKELRVYIQHDIDQLVSLYDTMEKRWAKVSLQIDTSIWLIVKNDFIQYSQDLKLTNKISFYYSNLVHFNKSK